MARFFPPLLLERMVFPSTQMIFFSFSPSLLFSISCHFRWSCCRFSGRISPWRAGWYHGTEFHSLIRYTVSDAPHSTGQNLRSAPISVFISIITDKKHFVHILFTHAFVLFISSLISQMEIMTTRQTRGIVMNTAGVALCSIPSTPYLKFLCKFLRIFFRECRFKKRKRSGLRWVF